ncbi:phosphatase 2C-like domain-containing protein [Powellomyces hirtus]|nr:phosphatase 2C-like domain-containing protein [Powellomyces hirtus]
MITAYRFLSSSWTPRKAANLIVGSTGILRSSQAALLAHHNVRLSSSGGGGSSKLDTGNLQIALRVGAIGACAGVMYYVTRPSAPAAGPEKNQIPSQLMGEPLSDEHTTAYLRQKEKAYSFTLDGLTANDKVEEKKKGGLFGWVDKGVAAEAGPVTTEPTPIVAYHTNQVASNSPVEDYHSENRLKNGVILGIYDGHGGTECANALSQYLGAYVGKALSELPVLPADKRAGGRKAQVVGALKAAFQKMDYDIINGAIDLDQATPYADRVAEMRSVLRPAIAGSCAIVAYMEGNNLYIACTGDSRAVVARRRGDGSYEAVELSQDQTTANPAEYARLMEEHPNEQGVVSRGRVLGGLMPTRAFGDSRYKWLQTEKDVLGMKSTPTYLTPPYVTAEPEVTYYHLDPTADKSLIIATDGIWDCLSSEQAVDLIGGYMQRHKLVPDAPTVGTSLMDPDTRAGDQWEWKDDNAATHLIRNAIGRGDPQLLAKLVRIPAPYSRRVRDDMTVNVVFFSSEPQVEMEGTKLVASAASTPAAAAGAGLEIPLEPVDLTKAGQKVPRFQQWVKALQKQRTSHL